TIYYNKYEKSIWFLRRRNPSTLRLESCRRALAHSDNRPRQPSKFSLLRTCIRLQPSSQNEREFKHLKLPGRARYDAKRDGDQSLGANRKHSDGDESCFVRRGSGARMRSARATARFPPIPLCEVLVFTPAMPPARTRRAMAGIAAIIVAICLVRPVIAQPRSAEQGLAIDIFKELIEINTVTATGDTYRAAEAMATRLRVAGFSAEDAQVLSPAPRKGNLVARLRGTGERKPVLLLAHLDVVEARREDWSMDPFKLIEQDGYLYGRGTSDDKAMAAAFVANLIRYRQEGYLPVRDIIVVLETDEEILDRNVMGIQWLLMNHRDLIEAEFALNEGGGVGMRGGKALRNGVQTSEKFIINFRLEVRDPGGHSSLPRKDNPIYRLAQG